MILKTISQSKLKSFEYCPAAFLIQYVLGLNAYNPHFDMGTKYHKSVELYHKGLAHAPRTDHRGNPLPGEDVRDDELIRHYTGACDCGGKLNHPIVQADEVLTAPDGHKMVEERIMGVELAHPLTGELLPPLTLVIDRVVSMGVLSDLKTSAVAWNQARADVDIQATLYLFTWWQLYKIPGDFEFVVVRKNPGPRTPAVARFTTTRTVEDFCAAWDWAAGVIKNINDATEWPCTCAYTGYGHAKMGILL